MTRHRVFILLFLFVMAFAVRAVTSWHVMDVAPDRIHNTDSPDYLDSGRALAQDGRFDQAPGTSAPEFLRTPGYPLLIAAVDRVAGGDNLAALLLVQAALGAATVVMVALIGLRLAAWRVGLVAAVLCSLDPQQVALSGIVLTETLFTFLVTAFVLLVVHAVMTADHRRAWMAGVGAVLVLVLATYVRPILLYFPLAILVAVVLAALVPPLRSWLRLDRRALAIVLGAGVAFYLLILPWNVRNERQVGWFQFSGIEAINLYYYRAAQVEVANSDRSLTRTRHDLLNQATAGQLTPRQSSDTPFYQVPKQLIPQQGAYLADIDSRATEILRAHPLDTAAVSVQTLPDILFGPGQAETLDYITLGHSPPPLAALYGLAMIVTFGLGALGVVLLGRWYRPRTHRALMIPVSLFVYYVLISAGPEGESRFRAPFMPVVFCFASVGALYLAAAVRERILVPRRRVTSAVRPGVG